MDAGRRITRYLRSLRGRVLDEWYEFLVFPSNILIVWLVTLAAAFGGGEYRFVVGGVQQSIPVMSLNGTPEHLQPGDLVYVSGWWITLDEPGEYVFETREKYRESLWRILPDEERLAGIVMSVNNNLRSGPEYSGAMPSKMPKVERQSTRGVKVEGWDPRFAKELSLLELSQVCVEHRFESPEHYARCAFPRDITRLVLDHPADRCAKLRLPRLLAARINPVLDGKDLEWLIHSPKLRALSLDFDVAEASTLPPKVLSALPDLRSLETSFGNLANVTPAIGRHPSLRSISMRSTDVGSALRDWTAPNLENLAFSDVTAECLPQRILPKLQSLELTQSAWMLIDPKVISDTESERFRTAHPQARMVLNWAEEFARSIRGVDRVRLRKGGECCWPKNQDLGVFDSSEPAEVSAFLDLLRAHPNGGVSGVMDCGTHAIEFYRGKELVRILGMWILGADRPVGFRFALEPQSAISVGQWVGRRMNGRVGDFASREQRFAKYREIMPEAFLPDPRVSGETAEVIVSSWPVVMDSPQVLASRIFSLYGCHEDDWNVDAGLDPTLRSKLLPAVSLTTIMEIGTSHDSSEHERNGLARWLFADGHLADLTDADLERLLSGIAREALVHPRVINRRMAMAALARRNTPATRRLLLEVITGELNSLPANGKAHRNASGDQRPFPECPTVLDTAPDAIAAAAHLLHHGGAETKRAVIAALPRVAPENVEGIRELLKKLEQAEP